MKGGHRLARNKGQTFQPNRSTLKKGTSKFNAATLIRFPRFVFATGYGRQDRPRADFEGSVCARLSARCWMPCPNSLATRSAIQVPAAAAPRVVFQHLRRIGFGDLGIDRAQA